MKTSNRKNVLFLRMVILLCLSFFTFSCISVREGESNVAFIDTPQKLFVNIKSDVSKDPHSAVMGLHLAQQAQKRHEKVIVFINVDAVKMFLNENRNLNYNGENLLSLIESIQKHDGEIWVCPHCLNAIKGDPQMLPSYAKISDYNNVLDKLNIASTVITY